MVNTFLVVPNFRKSATYLCRAHLGKQRTEAMQIRNMLLDLDYLTWYFEVEPPPRGAKREVVYTWVKELLEHYHGLPYQLIYDRNDHEYYPIGKGFKPKRAKDNEIFEVCQDNSFVYVSTKRGLHVRYIPIEEFLFPWQRLVGDGLRNHPVLALWYTHTDALGEYINCHIEEWLYRGYKNNMEIYTLPKKIEYPPWVNDPEFHRTMRARMREKEKMWWQEYYDGSRKQKPELWYTTMSFFVDAGEDTGYKWW